MSRIPRLALAAVVLTSCVAAFADVSVSVTGEVTRTGVHHLAGGADLIDLIVAAGGFTPKADMKRVRLVRGDSIRIIPIEWMLERSKRKEPYTRFPMEDGDIVFVREKPEDPHDFWGDKK